MANYLSGERIQGSSTATSSTPTKSKTQFAAGTWTSQGDTGILSESSGVISFAIDSGDDSADSGFTLDLGSGNEVSDVNWILRTKFVYSTNTISATANDCSMAFGIADSTTISGGGSRDGNDILLGTIAFQDNTNYSSIVINSSATNGTNRYPTRMSIGTTYYLQIQRVSATSAEFKVFSDSTYETQVGTTSSSSPTTSLTGGRYVFVHFFSQTLSSGSATGSFTDWELWSPASIVDDQPVASGIDEKVAITNVPAGTRYEETDTRKIYRKVNKTDSFTDSFTSSSAWSQTGDRWSVDASTDYRVENLAYSSYAPNDYVYHDMGASFHACDQSFNLRYKILVVGAGGYIQVGFTDNTTDGNSGDSLNAGLNTYNTAYGYTRIYDTVNGTFHEVETASSVTPSGMYNTAIWMEFAFNSTTNVATVKCFSNSDFTTPLNAGTQNLSHTLTMSDYQGLRYLFIGSIDASGRTLDSNCYVDDLTLYTGISDVDDAVSVEWQEKGTA